MSAPCPKNGKCPYCSRKITGTMFCILPRCAYPVEQRYELLRGITALAVRVYRTPVQEEKLERYRRYFRELSHRGGDP